MKWLLLGCFQGHRQRPSRQDATIASAGASVEAVNSRPIPNSNSEQLLHSKLQSGGSSSALSPVPVPKTDTLQQPRQSNHFSHAPQQETATLTHTPRYPEDSPPTPFPPDSPPQHPDSCVPRLSLDCGLGVCPTAPQPSESPFTTSHLQNLLNGSTTHDTMGSDIIGFYSAISECSSDLLRVRGGAFAHPAIVDLGTTTTGIQAEAAAAAASGPRHLASRVLRGRASLDALLLLGALVRAADEAGIVVSGGAAATPVVGPSRLERIESGDLPPTDDLPGSQGTLQGKHVQGQSARQWQEGQVLGGSGAARVGDVGCPWPTGPTGGGGPVGGDGSGGGAADHAARGETPQAATQPPPWGSMPGWTGLQSVPSSSPRAGGGSTFNDCGTLPARFVRGGSSGSDRPAAPILPRGTPARDADFTFYTPNASGSAGGGGGGSAAAVSHDNTWSVRGRLPSDSGTLSHVHQEPHRPPVPYPHSSAQHQAPQIGSMTTNAQVLELLMRLVTNTSVDSELASSANALSGVRALAPYERTSAGAATAPHTARGDGGDGDGDDGGTTAPQRRHLIHTTSPSGRPEEHSDGRSARGCTALLAPDVSGSLHDSYSSSATATAAAAATRRGSAPLYRLPGGVVRRGAGYRRNSCDSSLHTGSEALAMAAAAAAAAAGFLCSSTGGGGGGGAHYSRSRSRCGGGSSRFWAPGGGGLGGAACGPGSFLSGGQEDSRPASLLLVGALSGLASGQGGSSMVRLPTGSGSIRDVLSRVHQQQQLEVGALPHSSSSWSNHTGLASLFDAPLTAALRHAGAVRTFKRAVGGGALSLSPDSTVTSQLTGSPIRQDSSMTFTGSLVQSSAARHSSNNAGSSNNNAATTAAAPAAGGLSHLGAVAAVTGPALWLGGGTPRPPLRRATLSTVSSIRSCTDMAPPAGAVLGRRTQPGVGVGGSDAVRLTHMRLVPYCAGGGGGGGALGSPGPSPQPQVTYEQLRWMLERQAGRQGAMSPLYGRDVTAGPSASQQHYSPRAPCLGDVRAMGPSVQRPAERVGMGAGAGVSGTTILLESSWLGTQAQHRGRQQRNQFVPHMAPAIVSELGGSSDFSRFSAEMEWGPMGRGMEGDTFTLPSDRMSFSGGPGRSFAQEGDSEEPQ